MDKPLAEHEGPLPWRAWYGYQGRRVDIWCRTRREAIGVAKAAGGNWRHEYCQGRPVYRTRQEALAALRAAPSRYVYLHRCYLDEGVSTHHGRQRRRHHWHLVRLDSPPEPATAALALVRAKSSQPSHDPA